MMSEASRPFALPGKVEPPLERILGYWETLKRGQAEMPFADDVKLGALAELVPSVLLIDVFEKPARFRFAAVGPRIVDAYGADLEGKFVDEAPASPPLDFLLSQCSATVEGHLPTLFRWPPKKTAAADYARVLLPLWGDGHVTMLLGAVTWMKMPAARVKKRE